MAQQCAGTWQFFTGCFCVACKELLSFGLVHAGQQISPTCSGIHAFRHATGDFGHNSVETGRGVQEGHVIQAQFLGCTGNGDRLTHTKSHCNNLAAICVQLLQRAYEIGIVWLVRRLGDKVQTVGVSGDGFSAFLDVQTKVGRQIHCANVADAFLLGQIGHTHTDLLIICRSTREMQRVKRLCHLTGGRQRRYVWDVLGVLQFERRDVHRRTQREQHRKDFVAVDQLVHALDSFWHLVGVIFYDETDRATMNAASCVYLVKNQLRRFGCRRAE